MLADTLAEFAAGMLGLLAVNLDAAPGSPTAREAVTGDCVGQWSAKPPDDALGWSFQ